jgi:hypothetical protein
VLTARTAGWAAATPLFVELAADPRRYPPLKPASTATLLARWPPPSPASVVAPVPSRAVDVPIELARRIVIYTTCFGRPLTLAPLFGVPAGVRCLCFTDQAVSAPGWEVIRVDAAVATEAFYKLCPHRVLASDAPMANMSLYVAPDQVIAGNLHTLFTRWLLPEAFVLWRHAECSDWHELAEHHLLDDSACTATILDQARRAEHDALPRRLGAYDTRVLWRRHGDPAVATLMEGWWNVQQATPGPDDVGLYRLVHLGDEASIRPLAMPDSLGSAVDNAFFAHKPQTEPLPRRQRPARRAGAPLPITFLYAEDRKDQLMTLMRGKQLSEMAAVRLGEDYEISFTSDRHLDHVRDQVVILNLSFLAFASLTQLAKLRRNNIALITDWQDGIVDPNKVALCDAQMAMSLRQALDLDAMFAAIPAFHVTHHVNPVIRRGTPPVDRLRTLYFGATFNTVIPESLRDEVEVVNGLQPELDLGQFLQRYNCHWVVRRYVPLDQFWLVRGASPLKRASMMMKQWKPFLKGFVAARCGAVVLVTRDDTNAFHYLGDDYPFYAASLEPADLEAAWANVAATFGGPEWRHAQAIMRQVEARSSDAQVCAEFKAMVDTVVA